MKILAMLFLTIGLAFGATTENLDKTLPHYLEIQTALANDSFEKAVSAAKKIDDKNLIPSADKIKNAKNIKVAREEFKNLSKPFVEWVLKNKKDGLIVVDCSMAAARWVQKDGEIANPYFGSEMKTCGDKLPK